MMRWLTAGESHGSGLVGIIEGLPAGIEITTADVQEALMRRRLGYGRGARMKFEKDEVTIIGGVRHGVTLGSPIAIHIANTEWPKWEKVMNPDPVDSAELEGLARNAKLTRPRPGHADMAGMQKYGFDEARPLLERASARETATRVALGRVAQQFLAQLGITTVSHTVRMGEVAIPDGYDFPTADDVESLDADPLRCIDPEVSAKMVQVVDVTKKSGETLGGVVEVIVHNAPVGLGSHIHWDRRLDSKLAGALMGIQAMKGVEIGDGFDIATRVGSAAHDEIVRNPDGSVARTTHRAGGIEAGMSTGEPIRVRVAMKPIATVPRALQTVDVATGQATKAHHQRSDVTAVPASGVVAEAMVALVIAGEVLEKFGGDSVAETKRNMDSFIANIARLPEPSSDDAADDHLGDPL
ncbi:MAG TPA: chorismate synthase [Enteractinococcus helveticum]|uniref:Chorismate synthase n=1 Tax=Enteractinococcus helveticum TaxID=1837282 RepID=A0A921FNR4_9MICC|nr:chorismate synthase [Enteractinococcus helveticum]HJF14126.1 chorismate synthase [Enteractinococcus helveticum]